MSFFNLKYTRTYIFHTEPHPKRFQTIKKRPSTDYAIAGNGIPLLTQMNVNNLIEHSKYNFHDFYFLEIRKK